MRAPQDTVGVLKALAEMAVGRGSEITIDPDAWRTVAVAAAHPEMIANAAEISRNRGRQISAALLSAHLFFTKTNRGPGEPEHA